MVALHGFAAMIQRHCLFVLLVLMATNSRSISAQNISTAAESRETKTSIWWPVVECILLDDVNKCLQDRSVRTFVGLDLKGDARIDTEKETVKMPGQQEEGIFDMLGDLFTDGIKRIFQNDDKKDEDDEDDKEEDYEEETHEAQQAESGDTYKVGHADSGGVAVEGDAQRALETGRDIEERKKKKKKKKKKKAIKKAIIKLILLSVLIKLKIMKFFFVVGKLLKLKLVLLVTITTIINIIRFIWEWKSKKDAGKVAYTYEKTHHQHHYDEQHHLDHHSYEDEDKGWLSGLWSRSESYDGSGGVRSIADAHDIAYSAQKPTNTKLRV